MNNYGDTSDRKPNSRIESVISATQMDAAYFWQKAATCLRLAQTLSSSNPGRLSLLEMAEGFERRAKELESARPPVMRTKSARPDGGGVSRDQAR